MKLISYNGVRPDRFLDMEWATYADFQTFIEATKERSRIASITDRVASGTSNLQITPLPLLPTHACVNATTVLPYLLPCLLNSNILM